MALDAPNSPIPSIGFAIVSHRDPPQLLRLVDRLARLYPGAPIAIHHDLEQTPLDASTRAALETHARFVMPSCRTRWGRWSVVDATIRTLALLVDHPSPPEWITLLSGADYPVARADVVLHDLASCNTDALLQCEPVTLTGPCDKRVMRLRKRYLRQTIWFGDIFPLFARTRLTTPVALGRLLGPFSSSVSLHWGSQWFSCRHAIAKAIAESPGTHPKLCHWMRRTHIPDESFIPTLVMSEPRFRVLRTNRRFVRWAGANAPNPETLTQADLPMILASGAHFARKFDPHRDVALLDAIDRHLGL